jgi:DNA-binding HxlR family transcriptional regulator
MTSYGQFCPVAKASEMLAERWTPLILRELLCGSHRFSELERGLPKISRSLLSQRLRFLAGNGLVERRPGRGGRPAEYHLTEAGQDLWDVIIRLGEWSHRWFNPLIGEDRLDAPLLMWDIHRRLNADRLPARRVVIQFDFTGALSGSYWLVLEPGEPSVCWDPPGLEIDVVVRADALAMHRVWLGHQSLADALAKRQVELEGPRELVRAFPDWLALSFFASVERAYQTPAAKTA